MYRVQAADFFADEKTISKVCTELCSKLFADVPSRKRLRESSETDDTSEQDGSDESANFTDQEHPTRLVFSGHVPASHTPRRQLSDCGREVRTIWPLYTAAPAKRSTCVHLRWRDTARSVVCWLHAFLAAPLERSLACTVPRSTTSVISRPLLYSTLPFTSSA